MTVDLSLDLLYVDPTRISGRAQPVVESYRERLVAALADGATLPPLKVAPLADPHHPWYTPAAPHTQAGAAQRSIAMSRRPYSHLPAHATHALYDGHCIYWALREAGVTAHPCLVHDEPVGPDQTAAEQALRLLHLQANLTHGQALTDGDIRRSFVLLWLGRQPSGRETWTPGPQAVDAGTIADRLGRSSSWISQMKVYAQVTHAISVDLGVARAGQLGRLDPDLWRSFAWEGETLRLHALLDTRGRRTPDLRTVDQLTTAQLRALVEDHLGRPATISEPRLVAVAETDADDESQPPADHEPYQGVLPLDWGDLRERAETVHTVAKLLSNAQLFDMLVAFRPAAISARLAYESLESEARRRGLDTEHLLTADQHIA